MHKVGCDTWELPDQHLQDKTFSHRDFSHRFSLHRLAKGPQKHRQQGEFAISIISRNPCIVPIHGISMNGDPIHGWLRPLMDSVTGLVAENQPVELKYPRVGVGQ